ncbi:putative kynureninase [Podospora australis]|uniref:Kynureninase n=1 Tax=Podospora australis TaxID=1536484 RepID=A0AAN6WPH6_9PEZI|nr:putative kynureninase [Podospora australis]
MPSAVIIAATPEEPQKQSTFTPEAATLEYAREQDRNDKLAYLRDQFNIPTRGSLRKKALDGTIPASNPEDDSEDNKPSVYLVGNSLGAQPRSISRNIPAQLETWASFGVNGHFSSLENSPLEAWQDLAESCAKKSVELVGATSHEEIIYMNTLTVNLHLMMATFYKPTTERHKVIVEWKPFPSDWYAIQSQISHHGFDPSTSLIEIQPDSPSLYLSTETILSVIDQHASSTALLLLPGIQYYTGQSLNIPLITSYAQSRGIVVGWDLAHAAGNIPLSLHDWNVDFAVWCTYKYLNSGPGATSGCFVHSKHHGQKLPRLAGWYGSDKSVRFKMEKEFIPARGAAGWQLSNPSAIDLACVSASLDMFQNVGMRELRQKAVKLTGYLEWLLVGLLSDQQEEKKFKILTPQNPEERGSQLSLLLTDEDILEKVFKKLQEGGIICDARKPGVIRVAPVPMYCTFEDVWRFVEIFGRALEEV